MFHLQGCLAKRISIRAEWN